MIIGISGKLNAGKDEVGKMIDYWMTYPKGERSRSYNSHLMDIGMGSTPNWEIKKYAAKLKEIASIMLGVPAYKFEDRDFKNSELGPEWNRYTVWHEEVENGDPIEGKTFDTLLEANEIAEKLQNISIHLKHKGARFWTWEKRMTVREFLQKLGTEAMRNGIHTQAWVNALMVDYKKDANGNYPNWVVTDTRFPNEADAIIYENDASDKRYLLRVVRPGHEDTGDHPSETALDDYDFEYYIFNDGSLTDLMNKVKQFLIDIKLLGS